MTRSEKNKIIEHLKYSKLCGINYIKPIKFKIKNIQASDLPNDINELKEHVHHCSLCDLSKNKHKTMFSMGNNDSNVMMIGTDSKFADENLNIMINSMIKNILLLDINQVYITNILKCDTNINIHNLDNSIKLCKSYLLKQIEIVKPEIIITIGSAFNHLIDSKDNISDISGNLYNYNGIKLVPLLDLEFVYKNPSYKQDMFNDLKKIKMILEQK